MANYGYTQGMLIISVSKDLPKEAKLTKVSDVLRHNSSNS